MKSRSADLSDRKDVPVKLAQRTGDEVAGGCRLGAYHIATFLEARTVHHQM